MERIFSFRDKNHTWDPKNQRPEMWKLFNTVINKGESVRVFPISTLDEIIKETLASVESERTSRVIDSDGGSASMEKRKKEVYYQDSYLKLII